MRKRTLLSFASLVLTTLLLTPQSHAAETVPSPHQKIVLVGDSTVASKSGWGDAFARLLKPGVELTNFGRGGRSSKSYRDEGHWQLALKAKPQWIIIQFGHNDQPGKGPKRETDPNTTFSENLKRYIAEARAIGAQPVLVTSLTRRNFNSQGLIVADQLLTASDSQGAVMVDGLNSFVKATRAVAKKFKVPLIDLNARSIEQMNQLGPKKARAFDPKPEDPTKTDKTHLSEDGAKKTAQLVADEIRMNVPGLDLLLK